MQWHFKLSLILISLSLSLPTCNPLKIKADEDDEQTEEDKEKAGAKTPVAVSTQQIAITDKASLYSNDPVDVIKMYVTVVPDENPHTLEDVNNDSDPHDDFAPEVSVVFSTDSFAKGETKANAKMRLRGRTARTATQKSYRIKLNKKADLWRSSRHIQLNKHAYELSRVRNKLSFDLIATIPNITSLRTQFVHLFVNDTDYGLYTQVEYTGPSYLVSRELKKGNLYKAESFEFFPYPDFLKMETDPSYNKTAFEKKLEIKDSSDHTHLLKMLAAINDEDADFAKIFPTHFNLANYTTWLAINIIVGNYDTNSQNFYLYRPEDNTVWYILPWDYDDAWGFYDSPGQSPLPKWQQGIGNWWGIPLHQRFLKVSKFRAALTEKVKELKDNYLSTAKIEKRLSAYKAIVKKYVSSEPDVSHLPATQSSEKEQLSEWEKQYDGLSTQIAINYQRFIDSMASPMPGYLGEAQYDGSTFSVEWDASFQFSNKEFYYDFAISKTPVFASEDLLFEQKQHPETQISTALQLTAGTYYYRLIIRDQAKPETKWQTASDTYQDEETDTKYSGVKQFTVL